MIEQAKQFFRTAQRRLVKKNSDSVIMAASLAVGLAATILVLGYLRFELMYDRWVPGGERIHTYRALAEVTTAEGSYFYAGSPCGALDLPVHIPGVVAATAVGDTSLYFLKDGVIQDLSIKTAQPGFFEFFPLAVHSGDPKPALSAPGNVVLTEPTAHRLFGSDDPVGKTVAASNGDRYRVGAVIDPLPEQTHFDFDALVPSPATTKGSREWSWESGHRIYIKLAESVSIDQIRPSIETFTQDRISAPGSSGEQDGPPVEINLCPLIKLHIYDDVLCTSWEKPPVEPQRLYALAAIGVGILVLGTVNFANIALARSLGRGREAALRKVLGASRGRLIRQFLGESLLVAALSLLSGLALAAILREPFAALVGQGAAQISLDATVILGAATLAGLAGAAGGLYPAFIASGQSPASILVGRREAIRGSRLRMTLVAIQFTLAIGLAATAIVIQSQVRHILSVDPGFDAKGVVVIRAGRDHADALRAMEAALHGDPAIKAVARANGGPGIAGQGFLEVSSPKRKDPINMVNYRVGAAFFDIYKLTPHRPAGSAALRETWSGPQAILNEAALPVLGFATAEDALGAWLTAPDGDGGTEALQILGVAPNFTGVTAPPNPKIFTPVGDEESVRFLAVRPVRGLETQASAAVDRFWRELVPDKPIDRYFVEQRLASRYDEYRRAALAFGVAAGLALMLAATGLFGLAAQMAERRTQEIAIRKVLGARSVDVLGLVTWQLLKPVLPSMLLAWVVAWYFLRGWLEGFVIRIDLTPVPFVLAGFGAFLVGGLAVIGHAARVAALHPAHALQVK